MAGNLAVCYIQSLVRVKNIPIVIETREKEKYALRRRARCFPRFSVFAQNCIAVWELIVFYFLYDVTQSLFYTQWIYKFPITTVPYIYIYKTGILTVLKFWSQDGRDFCRAKSQAPARMTVFACYFSWAYTEN